MLVFNQDTALLSVTTLNLQPIVYGRKTAVAHTTAKSSLSNCMYFCSCPLRDLLIYIIIFSPPSTRCTSVAPSAKGEASQCTSKGREKSGCAIIGAFTKSDFNKFIASCNSGVIPLNGFRELIKTVNGFALSEKFFTNFL